MKAFLVGNTSIFVTSNKWVIFDFRQRFPVVNEYMKDGKLQPVRQDIIEHQNILMNLEQAKDFVDNLRKAIDNFESGKREEKIIEKEKVDNYIG